MMVSEPTSLIAQLSTLFGVLFVGIVVISMSAVFYFRRVRMERPPIGTFNGRDIVILVTFISVLPFLYGYLPNQLITCLLTVTFASALYIGYHQLLGPTRTWIGIGLLIGLNIWTSDHLLGTTLGWQLWWIELSVMVGLGAVAVANLYVQGGMRLQHVAWLSLALAVYDLIFATILPLTDKLVADYLSHPLDPLLGFRFGIDNYGVGLGDLLVYALFLTASYKAYGRNAARIALGLIVVVGAGVVCFVPLLFNFLDVELDVLVPSQVFFGPAAFLLYLWFKHRYGRERTMAEYLASQDGSGAKPQVEQAPSPEPASI